MRVRITSVGRVGGEAPGETPGFDPRAHVRERKHVKLMSRAVQLGVAAVRLALEGRPGWESFAPDRRALFVGTTPAGSEPAELADAFGASVERGAFSEAGFGDLGIPRVPPLWLVKGLSNNILGYASAYFDLQGVNGSRCDGRIGGIAALLDGARAIAEGRADLVIAGGADSLVGAEALLGRPCGEGAAFFVLEAEDQGSEPRIVDGAVEVVEGVVAGGAFELGAASGLIALCQAVERGHLPLRHGVVDEQGRSAWVAIA
jgi:hypothetical protein